MPQYRVYGILGLLALLVLNYIGLVSPGDLVFSLAFGWLFFLDRISKVRFNGSGLIIGLVYLTLFTSGLHLFLGWLHGQMQGQGRDQAASPWKRSWTTSLVAIIVLMFVAGLASVGVVHQTGWLITSSEPLLSRGGMMAVDRHQSVNNLKQIGLALYNYNRHEETASFPPGGTFDPQGRAQHGWQALILAQMDNQILYNQINFDLPWNARSNSTSFGTALEFYLNPAIGGFEKDSKGYALSHYSGNALVIGGDKSRNSKDITDGEAQTMMAGEVPSSFKPWGNPTNWRDPGKGINRSSDGFGSPFQGGANILFVDGSVRFIKDNINPWVWKALGTPSGGEEIPIDSY